MNPQNKLQINTGVVRLEIERDGAMVGELVFNPTDTLFAEKFYTLVQNFENTLTEYRNRMILAESVKAVDERGLPVNAPERLELMKETCEYVRTQIDYLFGEGTSEMLFGGTQNLEVYANFFKAITPYIQTARSKQTAQYIRKNKSKGQKLL